MKNIILYLALASINTMAFAHADTKINFHTHINGSDLQYNTNYVVNGTTINITHLGYYITNIRFVKDDSTETKVDTVLLVKADQTTSIIKGLGTGTYTSVKFDIGFADTAINEGDPSVYATGHPLALQNPSMHWSWATGYIFLRLDGTVDTSLNQTTGTTESLRFHLGTFNMVRSVTASLNNFYVNAPHGETHTFEADIVFNAEDFFSGIDLKQDNETQTMDNMPLAGSVADNLNSAFEASLQETTGVEEKYAFTNNVKLFPNPTFNTLNILITDAELQQGNLLIYDIAGKEIKSVRIADSNTIIDISEFPSGIYFIQHNAICGFGKRFFVE
jgi:hypothetical protein